MPLTPAERSLRAKLASHTGWANTEDRTARTAPGRRAAIERWERIADPHNELTPEARHAKAEQLRKAEMARLALASAKARRLRKEARSGDAA